MPDGEYLKPLTRCGSSRRWVVMFNIGATSTPPFIAVVQRGYLGVGVLHPVGLHPATSTFRATRLAVLGYGAFLETGWRVDLIRCLVTRRHGDGLIGSPLGFMSTPTSSHGLRCRRT